MNNLIGRFAINFIKPITTIMKNKDLDYILTTIEVKSFKPINSTNTMITYSPLINKEICEKHNLDYYKVVLKENKHNIIDNIDIFENTSIAIAAFTTSYARIFMNQIILKILSLGGKVYYTDTDSIFTDLDLEILLR